MKPFVPEVVFIGSFGLFCFVFLCRPNRNLMEFTLLGCGLACLESMPFYSSQFLPFGVGMPLLCLSHHCILETDEISTKGLHVDRSFAPV